MFHSSCQFYPHQASNACQAPAQRWCQCTLTDPRAVRRSLKGAAAVPSRFTRRRLRRLRARRRARRREPPLCSYLRQHPVCCVGADFSLALICRLVHNPGDCLLHSCSHGPRHLWHAAPAAQSPHMAHPLRHGQQRPLVNFFQRGGRHAPPPLHAAVAAAVAFRHLQHCSRARGEGGGLGWEAEEQQHMLASGAGKRPARTMPHPSSHPLHSRLSLRMRSRTGTSFSYTSVSAPTAAPSAAAAAPPAAASSAAAASSGCPSSIRITAE